MLGLTLTSKVETGSKFSIWQRSFRKCENRYISAVWLRYLPVINRPFKIRTDGSQSRVRELGSIGIFLYFYYNFSRSHRLLTILQNLWVYTINNVPQKRNGPTPDILMRGWALPDPLNWTPALFGLAYILEVPAAQRHWVSTVVRRTRYQCLSI